MSVLLLRLKEMHQIHYCCHCLRCTLKKSSWYLTPSITPDWYVCNMDTIQNSLNSFYQHYEEKFITTRNQPAIHKNLTLRCWWEAEILAKCWISATECTHWCLHVSIYRLDVMQKMYTARQGILKVFFFVRSLACTESTELIWSALKHVSTNVYYA